MVKREGTDQHQRSVAALSPSSAPVDGRGVADWLVYAQKFSQYIKYYHPDNQYHGQNWKAFLESDVSAVLALAAIQDLEVYKNNVNALLNQGIRAELGKSPIDETRVKQAFSNVFSSTTSLAWAIETFLLRLPVTVPLRATLLNLVQTRLAKELHKWKIYYQAAHSKGLIDESQTPSWTLVGEPIKPASALFGHPWSPVWNVADPVNAGIFGEPAANTDLRKIYFAINHHFFTGVLDQLLRALATLVKDAQKQLEETLASYNIHEPHMALFLAFLKLFLFARDQANTLTQAHLDFYYKEVLRLTEKPAVPSQAHIIVELNKFAESQLLPKDTLLQDGKDTAGKDVFFALAEDFVANQAKITALRSFYHATPADEKAKSNPATLFKDRLYASPLAHSENGNGAELTNPNQQWHPFANKKYQDGKLQNIAMPAAEVGFAVASHQLWLTEGSRMVTIIVRVKNISAPTQLITHQIRARVTTAKGWTDLPAQAGFINGSSSFFPNTFFLIGNVDANFPAIHPYNLKLHGERFQTSYPVLKFSLKPDLSDPGLYPILSSFEIETVEVHVSAQGLKDIQVFNDFGAVDPSQPFQPFGSLPQKDSSLIISHPEVFQKKGAVLSPLTITWKDLPASISPNPSVQVQTLQQGAWTGGVTDTNLFDGIPALTLSEADLLPLDYLTKPFYTVRSIKGFLRIRLNGDLGHKQYQQELTEYLIAKASGAANSKKAVQETIDKKNANSIDCNTAIGQIQKSINEIRPRPTEPYTPIIQSITLGYHASASLDLTTAGAEAFHGRSVQFFHLHPFGQTEEHPFLRRTDLRETLSVSLFPLFRHRNAGDPFFIAQLPDKSIPDWLNHEGAFYVGITQALPPQQLSILFQLAEGSASPLIRKPDPHVHWSFLSGNHWVSFAKQQVSDHTGQLTRSGIITFSLPKEADRRHTLLPEGFIWLRAAVETASEAVCSILAILPQATVATFQDQDNAPDFLTLPLPAGSIAKLQNPVAEIKKIDQPFATFGGQSKERASHFYQRVSERLRHKDRAVAIWDYEHLVLEQFPNIYKVKCLPHTRYEPGETKSIYNEQAAGHVTIVTIPNLRHRNSINPLQPYTNLGDLEKIEAYLRQHTSCFVKLHVRNPIFEQVRLKCQVKFFPQYDVSFYLNQLRREITQFLSPWAYGVAKDISFGGKIYPSTLIDFVEERPYVDYITDFELYHIPGNGLPEVKKEEIEATKACSILVSVPEKGHILLPIPITHQALSPEKCDC